MRQGRSHWIATAVGLAVVIFAAGCDESGGTSESEPVETEESPSQPSARAAAKFLEAVQYRDVEGAWEHHLESTKGGVYCSSEAFQKVLARTKKEKTERDCRDVQKFGPRRRADLKEDEELLVQILRFTCEMPDGTCIDYARKVFETQMPKSEFWARVANFEIAKVRAEDAEADVYVDYWRGERQAAEVHRRTLEMVRHEGKWYVSNTFGAEPPGE